MGIHSHKKHIHKPPATENGEIPKQKGSKDEKSARLNTEPDSCNNHCRDGHIKKTAKYGYAKRAKFIHAAPKLQQEARSRTRGDQPKVYDEADSQVEAIKGVGRSRFTN